MKVISFLLPKKFNSKHKVNFEKNLRWCPNTKNINTEKYKINVKNIQKMAKKLVIIINAKKPNLT